MTDEQKDAGNAPAALAAILAGGRSQRMLGRDKGLIELNGVRLVDRVIERLRPQAQRIVLSAPHDYGTGLACVPDLPGGPEGPVAGIHSVYRWLAVQHPDAKQFVTAPVDGPFVPEDLVRRLCAENASAVASDGDHDHPTFACWKLRDLRAAWPRLAGVKHVSLRALAGACGARRVVWTDPAVFCNLNSPEDIKAAGRLLC